MRRKTVLCAILLFAVLLPTVTACSGDIALKAYENPVLDRMLTAEYSLQELDDFIRPGHTNIPSYLVENQILFYDEVDSRFPIEILQHYEDDGMITDYTVYKVLEGGYYYVFWRRAYEQAADDTNSIDKNDPGVFCVHFSTYISAPKNISEFKSLKPGVSTIVDVQKLDPYFEVASLSSGLFTHSHLDPGHVLEIEYSAPYESYEKLVIKSIAVVPIEKATSLYRCILKEDLPWGNGAGAPS